MAAILVVESNEVNQRIIEGQVASASEMPEVAP